METSFPSLEALDGFGDSGVLCSGDDLVNISWSEERVEDLGAVEADGFGEVREDVRDGGDADRASRNSIWRVGAEGGACIGLGGECVLSLGVLNAFIGGEGACDSCSEAGCG